VTVSQFDDDFDELPPIEVERPARGMMGHMSPLKSISCDPIRVERLAEGIVVYDLPIVRRARPTDKLPELRPSIPEEHRLVPVKRATRSKKRPWWRFW
jgi:hypothetical protein